MYKSVNDQQVFVYAHNTINDSPETGLSGTGLEVYITKDNGGIAESHATADGNAVEVSSTNAKGVYKLTLTQAETDADVILVTGKSDVAGVEITPQVIETQTVMVGTDGAITSLTAITDDKDSYKATSVTVSDKTGFKLASDGADGLSAGSGDLKFVRDVLEGDAIVDTTTTPWQLVVKIKSTDTELIRKDLEDVSAGDVTSANTIVGRQTEPV